MNITKTAKKTINKSFRNTYIVHVNYIHGEEDLVTKEKYILKNIEEKELSKFMRKFFFLKQAILDNMTKRKDLPEEILSCSVEVLPNIHFWLEKDIFAREIMDNYFAKIEIDKILFYDEESRLYHVTIG